MSNSNLIENRQIRVFISSTFQDMQGERDYLMKYTFPILRNLASKRDVTLTELDLRWGITEEEAKTGKVVEICLREIENSIPFFIGIIGNRYGWVPEKEDIGENVTDRFEDVNNYLERHLSVTEMEMQFGVLQRKEDMHAYFYIKEGEDEEKSDSPEMLESQKKEVKASRYPSSTYSSPENLGIQVEQAFRTLLDKLFPEGHLSELEKERIGQRSFMRQLCQNYIRDDKNFQVIDAISFALKALEKNEKIEDFNERNITLSNTYNNIGIVYNDKGEKNKALDYYLKSLGIRETVLGKDHLDTAGSYNNIGLVYSFLNNCDKALDYHLKALKIRENKLGGKHPKTADSYNNIGINYFRLGDYKNAILYFMKALEIRENVLGTENSTTADSYHSIGIVYETTGAYDKALDYLTKALEIKKKTLGKEHPSSASSLDSIGIIHKAVGDYKKAQEFHMKALEVREKILGKDHLDTATSYNNIGAVYYQLYNYDLALQYLMKSLKVKEMRLGTGHPYTVRCYSSIGNIYYNKGDHEHALEWYAKSAKSGNKFSFNDLAWTYHLIGKNEEALPWAEKGVAAFPDNPNIIDTLATVYQGLGRYNDAMEQFGLCLKLKKEQGASEDSIHETKEKIEELKMMMKN